MAATTGHIIPVHVSVTDVPSFDMSSLADDGILESAVITSQSPEESLALEFQIKVKTGGTVNADGYIQPYITTSIDNSLWPDSQNKLKLPLLPLIANLANTEFISQLMPIIQIMNGEIPPYLKFVVQNKTGGVLDATSGNFSAKYLRYRQKTII